MGCSHYALAAIGFFAGSAMRCASHTCKAMPEGTQLQLLCHFRFTGEWN